MKNVEILEEEAQLKKNKTALILLNMGGPNNLDEVEVFLNNMFNDKHILTIKCILLRKFVAKMIVTSRKKIAIENYSKLGGKSPIVGNTQKLVKKLRDLNVFSAVEYVMRYTLPFSDEVLKRLKEDDIQNLILFPLYPQYSTTTTLSSFEDINENLVKLGWSEIDALFVKPYFNNYLYNQQVVNSITKELLRNNDLETENFHLIFSAHGLPQKIVDNGDPYVKHLEEQIKIIKSIFMKEKINFASIELAYQSKVGPMKWLEPSLETTLKKHSGNSVIVYPISFTIDNSETDLELDVEYREVAEEYNLKDYIVVKALNDSDEFVKTIVEIASSSIKKFEIS